MVELCCNVVENSVVSTAESMDERQKYDDDVGEGRVPLTKVD